MVMVVSRWPASAIAEVSLVSKSPRVYVLCAKKFVLQAQNGRITLFSGVLGKFFAEEPLEGPCWANFVAWDAGCGSCWANFVPLALPRSVSRDNQA